MTITALSQPDYDTDLLLNGNFVDSYAQDADADYDISATANATATEGIDVRINQNTGTFMASDNYTTTIFNTGGFGLPQCYASVSIDNFPASDFYLTVNGTEEGSSWSAGNYTGGLTIKINQDSPTSSETVEYSLTVDFDQDPQVSSTSISVSGSTQS